MNQVEKKYTVKRMIEIKDLKALEIKHSATEYTPPKTFTVPQIMKLIKGGLGFEAGDIKDRNWGGHDTDITKLVLPSNYQRHYDEYKNSTAKEERRIEDALAKLEKFCSDLSDKTMLGSDADALNALQQMTDFTI